MELGDLEETVRRFAEMLGWNDDMEELMRSQETLVGSILKHNAIQINLLKIIMQGVSLEMIF